MKLLLVSDAWHPQVNGVVTSLVALVRELQALGHEVKLLSPADFRSLPCPTYPEIPLVWNLWQVGAAIRRFNPDCVHLATEGPLGWTARRWLLKQGMNFTTAIHTRFPEYLSTRWPWINPNWGYAFLRHFHRPSQAVLVTTERLKDEFAERQFLNLHLWRKGVDTQAFHPAPTALRRDEPVFLYVGRIAPEKNLDAFLQLELPGEKWIVGDGPQRQALQSSYPKARFLGYQHGQALTHLYQQASVLVFPSRTDTYGLVMLEALACGTPVAAYPVAGPLDVLVQGESGIMDESLQQACLAALNLDRTHCAALAAKQSWQASALEFLALQTRLDGEPLLPNDWQITSTI